MVDIKEIMSIIPHRYPFLLIDRITELEEHKRAVGIKNVTVNEPFFQGHFPGNPVMPGVLTIEAMAQVAGVLAYKSGAQGKSVFFLSIEKAKFRKPIFPGDQIRFEVTVLQQRSQVWKFSGKALVGTAVMTEGEFVAMITDREV